MHRRSFVLLDPRIALCTLLLAALLVAPVTARDSGGDRGAAPTTAGRITLPTALLPRVNASFAADDPAYAVAVLPDGTTMLQAANPAHGLTTTFAPDGLTFVGQGDTHWGLRLTTVGADTIVPTVAPVVIGKRVEYRRDSLTEWYVNGPLGVEQGFTLIVPPSAGDALTLTLATGLGVTPRLDHDAVTLTTPGGEEWSYGHLLVTDATGKQLPARLSVADDTIAITADLAGAVYPVTVDPLVETKKLIASDGATNDGFGFSVGMSNDSATVIVGAPSKKVGANTSQGEAYIYSGANYATEKKLTASDGAANDNFGSWVRVSGDGTRVIVGAPSKKVGANTSQGEAYIYSGANYVTEKSLTASDGAVHDGFGSSVGISSDGTRVIVGALSKNIGANVYQGAAYVYSGTNYGTEKKLTASDGDAVGDYFGASVAMSGDGTRVIVGAYNAEVGAIPYEGAAYVYSGTNYSTEKKLTASDGADGDDFGYSVAMNGDGTRVIVGAGSITVAGKGFQGAAYVYSGTNYGTEKKLTASDGTANDYFGLAVAMSADGTRVIAGAPYKDAGANASQGAAYVYSGTNYGTEQKLTASDGTGGDQFGSYSLAMSGDGTQVIVGAPFKNGGANSKQGAAYVFTPGVTSNPGPPTLLPSAKPTGSLSGSPGPAPSPKTGGPVSGGSPNLLPQARP